MEPNPPRTAKEAALQGAQADKPPFNPEADRRHVIASAIRRAGEFTGQTDPAAEAADEMQRGNATSDTAASREMLGGWEEVQSQTVADAGAAGDLSLADMILADQAESQGFAVPLATPNGDDMPPLGSSFDALQSPNLTLDASTQTDSSASPPTVSEFAQLIDRSIPANVAPDVTPFDMPVGISGEFPPIQNSQFDAFAFAEFNAPSLDSSSPSGITDLVGRYDAADPRSIVQLPYNPADEPARAKIHLLSTQPATADALSAGESRTPITYLPFGEAVAAATGPSAPREKRRIKFESDFADVKTDAVVAFLAMEPALLKAIDQAGEQDRRDALMRAASRRACL